MGIHNLERLLQLALRSVTVGGQQKRLRPVAQCLARPCHHPEPGVLVVRLSNQAKSIARIPVSRVGPSTEPTPRCPTVRQVRLFDQRAQVVGEGGNAVGVSEANLHQRVAPDRNHLAHGLFQLVRAGVCLLHPGARLIDQTKVNQMNAKKPEQGHLSKAVLRSNVDRLQGGQNTFNRHAGRLRPPLHQENLCPHGTGGELKDRSYSLRRAPGLGPPGLAPRRTPREGQARSRSCAEAGRAWMLRDLVEQHVRALKGVPGFASDPKQMERGHAAQGHEVDLQ